MWQSVLNPQAMTADVALLICIRTGGPTHIP